MSLNLRRFTVAVFGFDAVVRRVPADGWDAPSPCPGWTARHVVGHQIGVLRNVSRLARQAERDPAEPTDELAIAGDDPAATWAAFADDLFAAIDRPGVLQRVVETPFGTMPIDDFLGAMVIDPLAHTWDLAVATGQPPALDAGLAAEATAVVLAFEAAFRAPGRLGPAVEVSDDADAVTRFVATMGRDPDLA
ncbi:MAG: TIGR03086 family metal-binding protein [Actinomycetota bacterium]